MEELNSQQPAEQKPQGSNNVKTSVIAVVVLLVLIAAYAFSEKKSPESIQTTNTEDGGMELDDDGDEVVARNTNVEPIANTNTVSDVNANVAPEPANQNSNTNQPVVASAYKDGTYSSVGDYVSPGGAEQVGVSLTLKDGVVVDSTFTVMATRPISKNMQNVVSENYKQYVIGKPIDEVVLNKVSSSSLTPLGFNDAVAKIKQQAQG